MRIGFRRTGRAGATGLSLAGLLWLAATAPMLADASADRAGAAPGPPHAEHLHAAPEARTEAPAGSFFGDLLRTYTPRRVCMDYEAPVIWLHVVSDGLTALAYYSIPFALACFLWRRKDLAFSWMFWLFALFILACGTTHLFGVIDIWRPYYRVDGVVKAVTAVASVGTAAALWPLLPKALALPSPAQLEQTVRDRTAELAAANQALRQLNDTLEQRVAARTAVAERRAGQLRALAMELSSSEDRERKRLAQMLHDELQQILVAAKLRLPTLRKQAHSPTAAAAAQQAEALIDQAVEVSRSLTADLSPPILYDAGLAAALHWLARRSLDQYDLKLHVEADEPGRLPESLAVFLFQAARELVFNVVKHAGVKEAWLTLQPVGRGPGAEQMELRLEDRGAGFDSQAALARHESPAGAAATATTGGFGLLSIRERAEWLGGSLEIRSAAGQGSTVILRVPGRGAGG